MSGYIYFSDFNFKLAVIDELMYNQEVITPKFDIRIFIEKYSERKIDYEKEGHAIIPEIKSYFENLQISKSQAEKVQEIDQDGGEIYGQLFPFWDGEDNTFTIRTAKDVKLLPNLKRAVVFYDDDEGILEQFQQMGVEAEYV